MLLTVCTINQLPQALTLGASFAQHNPSRQFIIGLADDPDHLPAGWSSPYPLLTLADAGLSATDVALLSTRYTATEFRAACKPAFIRTAYKHSGTNGLLYADPSAFIYHSLDGLFAGVAQHSVLLNPHWLAAPTDKHQPDEKHLQNVGLYSSGLIGFGRYPGTEAMLTWWENRTADRAHIDFCAGQCLDQLWLMHVPALYEQVGISKDTGLQVALWNLPERLLANTPTGWQVRQNDGLTPLLTADFLGLSHLSEGLFQHQNRLEISRRPDVRTLLSMYRSAHALQRQPDLSAVLPAYGQQPEPIIIRGWRRSVSQRLQWLSDWIDNVPVPPIHR